MSLIVLAVVVVVFVWNRLPVEIVALGTALTLYAVGLLEIDEALAGFGDPVVIFLASLFVVSAGLDSSGVTTWASSRLMERVGTGRRRLLLLAMAMSALLTAFITLNGAVAALLPMVVAMAVRSGQSPSQLAMPLAFAGSAGSLLILTGTPVNVIVSDASADAGAGAFGFFEFALVGVPLVAGTVVIALYLGPRVLPATVPRHAPPDLGDHARLLIEQYAVDGNLYRLRVREHSPLVGTGADDAVPLDAGVTLVGVRHRGRAPRPEDGVLAADDVLVVRGDAGPVNEFMARHHLAALGGSGDGLLTHEVGVAEIVIPPRSRLIGEVVVPGMRRSTGLVVLAVHRLGRDRGREPTTLEVGDTLLVEGTWDALDQNIHGQDALVVDSPDLLRRQAPGLGPRGRLALAVLAGMVLLLALGVVPAVVAGLLAALAMVLLRVVRIEQAYRSISWTTVVLIGGLIPLSTAIQDSGAAEQIADVLIGIVGDGSPHLLLLGIFVLIGLLGQIVSNTATALIVVPVALAAAAETGVAVQPVLMLVTVAAAASFLTPIATPGNMMVMGPGGYRFGDYWKLGLPIMGWFLLVGVFLVPAIWRF